MIDVIAADILTAYPYIIGAWLMGIACGVMLYWKQKL